MKQSPSVTTASLTGSASEFHSSWLAWIDVIPEDERHIVADILTKHELDSLPSVNAFAKDVIVAIFKGQLSPAVAQAAKPWLDLICTNVHAMHQAQGTDSGQDIITIMAEIRKNTKPLQPVYRSDVLEADERQSLPLHQVEEKETKPW